MAWAAPAVVCPFISVTLGVGKFGPACHWAATDRTRILAEWEKRYGVKSEKK